MALAYASVTGSQGPVASRCQMLRRTRVVVKLPSPVFSETHTPPSPNPTMSAHRSPVRSARNRGCRSTRQSPAENPKSSTTRVGGLNVPSPLFSETHTPPWPNQTMSAHRSPVRSARNRGCRSTRHPPAENPKSSTTRCGAPKLPSPLFSETHTPPSPNPTMSAHPSPVRSARKRGCRSTRQPPAENPKLSTTRVGGLNVPSPLFSDTHTPPSPKPTTSARPSPVRSARKRGCRSTRQPPAENPKLSTTRVGGLNVPSPLFSDTHTPPSPKPTTSARPSPVRSARKRGCR